MSSEVSILLSGLKANVLHSMGVSTFLLISIITILDGSNRTNHLTVVKGLLFLSILILGIELFSFCDEYYNKVALYDDTVSSKEHIDGILHIVMIVTLIILEIAFVYTRLYN